MIKFVTSVAFGIMISRSSIAKSRTYNYIWLNQAIKGVLTLLICSIRVSQWVLKSGSVSIASWSFVFAVMLALLFGLAVGFGLSTNDEYCFLIGRDFGLFKIDLGLGA